MPRRMRYRNVDRLPKYRSFKPVYKNQVDFEIINLTIVELEAMRLKDIEGYTQEECATKMDISRQTFQNILSKARKKVVTALMEGQEIDIRGGNYRYRRCNRECNICNVNCRGRYW